MSPAWLYLLGLLLHLTVLIRLSTAFIPHRLRGNHEERSYRIRDVIDQRSGLVKGVGLTGEGHFSLIFAT